MLLVPVLLAVLLPVRGHAANLDTIIIDAGYDKQTTIAVVPFLQGPEFDGQQPLSEIGECDRAPSG